MDHAVALVEAYLQINGYFTVAEYPVIEAVGKHQFKTATDLDILAFRFPGAGRIVTGKKSAHSFFSPDPHLGISGDEGKLIGVLENSGGITSALPDIVNSIDKDTGAKLIYESNPEKLVDKLITTYEEQHFQKPSCFCSGP